MKIRIFERFQPFSHVPGIRALLPGTKEVISAYPAKVNEEILPVEGPVKEWTFFQNLERGKIEIRGMAKNGFFSRQIEGTSRLSHAKLSFGVHKAQEMEKIQQRCSPEEFLPFWFALGQYYTDRLVLSPEETLPLGESLLNGLQTCERTSLYDQWRQVFQAGFDGWMIPRLVDGGFHGFPLPPVTGDDPFLLLTAGVALICRMFVTANGEMVSILPHLPPEFHCGKLVDLTLPGIGVISLEWSKKEIKKMILHPHTTGEFSLVFPKRTQSYRMTSRHGTSRQTIKNSLKLEKDNCIIFDQFQH